MHNTNLETASPGGRNLTAKTLISDVMLVDIIVRRANEIERSPLPSEGYLLMHFPDLVMIGLLFLGLALWDAIRE